MPRCLDKLHEKENYSCFMCMPYRMRRMRKKSRVALCEYHTVWGECGHIKSEFLPGVPVVSA